jgi:chromosome condensin MukBEF MukE localization factor
VKVPTALAAEVCAVADAVLRARQHDIVDDLLDGRHWAVSCYQQAIEIVRRRHSAERRRALSA